MTEPKPETEPKPKTFPSAASIGDGMKTLLLSLIAYSTLFAFECGYCDWFRMPRDFIRFDVTRFLICAAALSTFLMMVLNLAQLAFEFGHRFYSKQRALLRFFAPMAFGMCLGLLLFTISYCYWPILWVCIGTAGFVQVGLALLLLPRKGSFRERVAAIFAKRSENNLGTILVQRYGYFWQILGTGIAVLLAAAYFAGMGQARTEHTFLVVLKGESLVVLRVYGDRAICAPLSDSRHLKPIFSVWDINKGNELPLELRRIGPLSMRSR